VTPRGGARTPAVQWVVLFLLLASAVGVQATLDGRFRRFEPARSVLWVQSRSVMRRLALGFDALAADVYWVRAVQYYGSTKLAKTEHKNYDLLFPLLDMTTTLDPRFTIAYRFGAILLSEPLPNGPERPDQAIALLEKGIRETPDRWEYYHDAGFIEYWWRQDNEKAADWFLRAAKVPDAPEWMPQLAATVLAEGGSQESARELWLRMAESDQEWMRQAAQRGLMRLDAERAIEQLQAIVNRFYDDARRFPASWDELARAGRVRGIPLDPTGEPYVLDPVSGAVDVAPASPLFPLRIVRTAP
jgi:tetratricopeptide (TPR) repeat protein